MRTKIKQRIVAITPYQSMFTNGLPNGVLELVSFAFGIEPDELVIRVIIGHG